MLICHDLRTGTGCESPNKNNAQFCATCGKPLRFALQLRDPGDSVGHYRVLHIIGHGGFGAVYAAEDLQQPGVHVALKETFDPDQIQSFQAEFAVLARLQHPHLPRYHAVFKANGNGYLVMELVPGQSLEEVLKKQGGPLLEAQVLGYALQLCDALAYLHRQTPMILHRDIKPANVRLTPEGLIKLVDFGLVKEGGGTTRHSRRAVTPPYAPPEQWGIGGQHTDPRSDLYALGATLYHLLTGLEPPPATDRISVTPDPLLTPHYVNPSLSPAVSDAIVQSMALAANQRPANATAFRRSLWGGVTPGPGSAGPGVSSSPPPPSSSLSSPTALSAPQLPIAPPPPPKPRSMGWLVWLSVLGSAALIVWYVFSVQNVMLAPPTQPAASAVMEINGVPYVYVPAGEFLMGSPDGAGYDDEHPQHTVYLDAFWIMQTEVTNAQYAQCVTAGACSAPDNSRWQDATYADHPVTDVDWKQATEYAAWAGGRLPTEAEWEKAARGTDGRSYPWGDEQPNRSLSNCCEFVNDTTPVGSYPAGASPYGALDMAGNVWEWTADWYNSGYYNQSLTRNPTGPASGDTRTVRGGADYDASVRVSERGWGTPDSPYRSVGIRVVLSSGS